MKKLIFGLCTLVLAGTASAQNQPPVLEQLLTTVDPNAGILHITYSVSDPENDPLEVQIQFSSDGGRTFADGLPAAGDLGFPVTPGTNKNIEVDINALTGISALMITDGANFRNACYHTARDTAEDKLTFSFMADVLRATIATAAQMAGSKHGDWATAPFNALVATNSIASAPCNMQVRREENRLAILFEQCTNEQAHLELFNTQGQLLIRSSVQTNADTQWINLPPLVAGTYIVQVHTHSGTQTALFIY